ncbi:MAG: hypothetical protein JST65_03700, partial [Acidobacteria bacterium]|nr:hypothetical protein [Acidobacteriota bacterium]
YLSDVPRVASLIRDSFAVDWANSENKSDRLRTEEFGYLSDHYVISFSESHVAIPTFKEFQGLKAEVQLRSILQHAWAEIEHDDLGYKNTHSVPRDVRRGLARVAALLEVADREFASIRGLADAQRAKKLPTVRAEGLAERIPDTDIAVPVADVICGNGDLILFFNTNVTTSIGPEQNAYVVTEDSSSSNPVRGAIFAANALRFPKALPEFVRKDRKYCRFKFTGIRLNANQLGVGTERPTILTCALAAKMPGQQSSTVFSTQELAHIQLMAEEKISLEGPKPHSLNAPAALLDRSTVQFADLNSIVRAGLGERLPGAFLNRERETDSDRRLSSHGTRVVVQFSGVLKEVELWVTTTSVGASASAPIMQLTRADSNGAGKFDPLSATKTLSLPGGASFGLSRVSLFNSHGLAVWEVTGAGDGKELQVADVLVIPFYVGTSSLPGWSYEFGVTISFGPLSTIGTASDSAPIPRFVPRPGPRRITFGGPS